jgi:hypothetical protein
MVSGRSSKMRKNPSLNIAAEHPSDGVPITGTKVPADSLAIISFAVRFDAPIPLAYWSSLIARSAAFKASAEGRLRLESVGRKAGIRPSTLAAFLKNGENQSLGSEDLAI